MTELDRTRVPARIGWVAPVDVTACDRCPRLTPDEWVALDTLALRYPGWTAAQPALRDLERVVRPLYDALERSGCRQWWRHVAVRVVVAEVQRRGRLYWHWTEQEWAETIGATAAAHQRRHGAHNRGRHTRRHLAVLAYVLGGMRDLSPFFAYRAMPWVALAGHIFGLAAVEEAATTVYEAARSWGYRPSARPDIRMALTIALLDNRSPHLADLAPTPRPSPKTWRSCRGRWRTWASSPLRCPANTARRAAPPGRTPLRTGSTPCGSTGCATGTAPPSA